MNNVNFNKVGKSLLNNMKEGKRGQVTLFVIISILVVVAIIILYTFVIKPYIEKQYVQDPKAFVEECAGIALTESETTLLNTNLYPNLTMNYILYSGEKSGEKVPYLCSVSTFYTPCINQEPMLLEKMRKYIEEYTKSKVEQCFKKVDSDYKKRGFEVKAGNITAIVEINKKIISININRQMSITKGANTKSFESFTSEIKSPMYDLIRTAMQVVNYESTLCEFNNVRWMLSYPEISIKKFSASDQTKVYTLTDRDTEKEIKFAVKTCVLPAGV